MGGKKKYNSQSNSGNQDENYMQNEPPDPPDPPDRATWKVLTEAQCRPMTRVHQALNKAIQKPPQRWRKYLSDRCCYGRTHLQTSLSMSPRLLR